MSNKCWNLRCKWDLFLLIFLLADKPAAFAGAIQIFYFYPSLVRQALVVDFYQPIHAYNLVSFTAGRNTILSDLLRFMNRFFRLLCSFCRNRSLLAVTFF